ncbi:MAG: C10 family peptidase [Prevotella sp.]|nr:C10 family peptidase [Prevotella sp.]
MRKLITFFILLRSVVLHAQQITPDEAAAIASEFLSSSSPQLTTAKRVGVKRAKAKSDAADDLARPYYVFNGDNNQGFVIVSGDKRAKKILGYSDTGTFDFDNLPPQLAAILEQYAEQIKSLPESTTTDPSWGTPTRTASTGEGKLLETANWGQGYPYNALTPEIDGQHAPTGCVATAMAIIIKYHNWPEQGRSFSDFIGEGTIQHLEFSQFSFNYDLMPLSMPEEPNESSAKALSELMLAAGRSVNMSYGTIESGAYFEIVAHQLQEKFSYSPECEFLMSKYYNWDEWEAIIKSEIDKNQPVLYSGSSESSKHAFICDGYKENYFHINWGWDGLTNGYFNLSEIMYSLSPSMVINIVPDKSGTEYARPYLANDGFYTLFKEVNFINVSVPDIKTGVKFDINSPTIRTPYEFNGDLGFALVDRDNNIKEVFTSESRYNSGDIFNEYGYDGGCSKLGVVIESEIEPDDRLQLVAREINKLVG